MAMITRAASKYSVFNDIVNTTTYTIKHNNKRKTDATAIQRHKMVWPTSGYYYDGIIGGKQVLQTSQEQHLLHMQNETV